MTSVKEYFQSMDYASALEGDGQARAWLEARQRCFGLFIGGAWQEPSSQSYFSSTNPADNQALADIAQGSAEDVDRAVAAATQALIPWQALGGHGRARYLYALARQVQKHGRLLAVLESLDNGKVIRESRDIDIPLAARHFYHHAGWAQTLEEEFFGYEPLGVVGQIIPWNFPLLMLAWKVAPALAAGCTVVLKPAEYTSLTALKFAEICHDIGLPAGVVNIVTGDGSTGEEIVGHEGVSKIAFTGSTEVGKQIRQQTAGSGKRLSLELGGKSPFIVFEDADLDAVVEGVVDAIWFNQGQVCCAGSRLLVQENIEAQLVAKLTRRMQALRVGNPLDKSADMGAIVAPVQLERIRQLVEQGIAEGAECIQQTQGLPDTGCFYPPTLLHRVSTASVVAREEIFGPVLVSMSFRTYGEAIALANNSRYGLAASVWSEDMNMALEVAQQLKAGVVWINSSNHFDAASGFGGYRESGFGREGGREGMYEYLKPSWQGASYPISFGEEPKNLGDRLLPPIDRTPKLYIGGKQSRPDSGYSLDVHSPSGRLIGQVAQGSRKDIRNAVEAAHKASGWTKASAYNRAQVLYFLAENLELRRRDFEGQLEQSCNYSSADACKEVDATIERIFYYAAMADKYEGLVHQVPSKNLTIAVPEAWGVMAIVCPDEAPLLAMLSLLLPCLTMGNRAVLVPSEAHPLLAADLYQVLDTSDVPAGAVNIVTGSSAELSKTLAEHDDIAAMWYRGSNEGVRLVEQAAAHNLKYTWASAQSCNWLDGRSAQGREYLRRASQVKNIWLPYGE